MAPLATRANHPIKSANLIRQTALLTALSIGSPVLGMLSEAALAWRFGATGTVDAYRVTVLLLLYGQQLFVTAVLPFVLVPIFAECRSQGREEDAWAIADAVAKAFLIFGIGISAFLFIRPDLAVNLIAPGLVPSARETALFFMRWCGLGFLPICWTGAACGILYAFDVMQIGALSQLVSNLMLVLAIVFTGGSFLGVNSLVLGVLGGAIASTAVCTYKLREVRRRYGPLRKPKFRLKSLSSALRLAAPLLGAIVVGQSTSVIVNRSLSTLAAGSLASFGYAIKLGIIVQLAPNAITTVLFPRVSKTWFTADRDSFGALCAKAVRATLYISIPLTCICFALQSPIVEVLLGRGAFRGDDIRITGKLFGLMVIAAPASTVVVSLSRAFYACQLPRFPVLADISGNACELAAIPQLASKFGLLGVAFGYMLLPWITGTSLLAMFVRRNRTFLTKDLIGFTLKITAVSVVCAWLGSQVGLSITATIIGGFQRSALLIALTFLLSTIGYFGGTLAFALPEAQSLENVFLKVFRKLASRQLPAGLRQ